MHLSALSISSVCLCIAVWMELLHSILRHTAPQSPRLPQDIIFILLPVISLLCRLTHWVHMDVGLSLSLAQWHGTYYQDIWVILFTSYLFLDDYLRHFNFQSANICSALEVFGVDALYKFTFYLLFNYLDACCKMEYVKLQCISAMCFIFIGSLNLLINF